MHRLDSVTTYPIKARVCNYSDSYADFPAQIDCIIGNAVWCGNNVHIMQGVKIGDGAVLGSNAVITNDVPPYSVVGGVPARVIRTLWSQEQIEYFEKIKWWDWEVDKLKMAIESNAFDGFEQLKKFAED